MWVYFVFDLVAYTILILISAFILLAIDSKDVDYQLIWLALKLLFPSIQAFGVCFFKSTMDPISKVSALFYHKIISINQVPTLSYWKSMMKEVTIEKKEHQKQLFEDFVKDETIDLSVR